MVTWLRRTGGGHQDAPESRVAEGVHSFLANAAPAGGSFLVFRRTGEYWHVGPDVDFTGLLNAADEATLRAVASAYADLDHPAGTIAPGVAREQVASWLAERHDWRHVDDRITDLGWMFLVNTQPDEFLDGTGAQNPAAGPIVVVKASGAVWWLPFAPHLVPAIGAPDEQRFHEELAQAGHLLNQGDPHEWLRPAVATRELVAQWLAEKYHWRHLEDRIVDRDWVFVVNTQPDAYLDGNENAMTYGNGPLMIVKRTGAVWALSSSPATMPVVGATDEQAFDELMRTAEPHFDRDRPSAGWLPGMGS